MATDVARLSFDPARAYRGVVPQQGRVSLEAEQNEQRVIDVEERRKELIDIIGPTGTPDDGYAVSDGKGYEIVVGAGTMYVGGWRVELAEDMGDYEQTDWLDRGGDWAETGREHVVLMVQETDVTAVEDPALYEVAIGGPDGSARTRLLQRVVRLRTDGATCAEALEQDRKRWARRGLVLDPATMELRSQSRLLVTWEGDPEPVDPCEPSSTGGYLGAENQLIRVQITAVHRDGTFDLAWGYDDASFLYRVTADASANPVLTLDRTPVDDYHRPRAGQAVQALRATAALHSTDDVVEGYVAALGGVVGVLAAPYDPDTKTVQFPAALPMDYTDSDDNPQLFLRVWEELLTGVEMGKAMSLAGTGMQVTIDVAEGNALHVDDFWCIGVRPSTPTTVYPERYLRTPQPPDGPRQWVCPLAVVEWNETQLVLLEDCRNHFRPLVEGGAEGCCTVEVRPSDAASGRLQELIDKAAAGRQVREHHSRVTVCFAPGRYELSEPLVLRKQHSNMTLRGCTEAAVLAVREGKETNFGHGLIVLDDVDNLTITGFELVLPQVPMVLARVHGRTGGVFNRETIRAINAEVGNRYVSIGIRPINCAVLEIDRCLFRFSLGEHQTTLEDAQTMPRAVFGVGILAAGGAWGLRLTRNRFLHDPTTPQLGEGPPHILVGYLLTQLAVPQDDGETRESRALGTARLRAIVDEAEIDGNEFRGLTAAMMIAAELGDLRIWDNVVTQCYAGFWILDVAAVVADEEPTEKRSMLRAALDGGLFDPLLVQVVIFAMLYPLPGLAEVRGVQRYEREQLAELRARSAEARRAFMARLEERFAAEQPGGRSEEAESEEARAEEEARRESARSARSRAGEWQLSRNVARIWAGLAELARLDPANDAVPTVRVERNAVECDVPSFDASTGPGLFLVSKVLEESRPAIDLSANRIVAPRSRFAAVLLGASLGTVTGNTIVGGSGETPWALVVSAVEAVAITGNLIQGQAMLPANRPFPAPLNTWLPLNTIV